MKFILLLLTIVLPKNIFSQTKELDSVRLQIKNVGYFDSEEYGNEIICRLENIPSRDLVVLIKEGQPLEKIYSFWEYSKRKESDFRIYFHNLVIDTNKVRIPSSGCLINSPKSVGSLTYQIAGDLSQLYGVYNNYPLYLDSMALELTPIPEIKGDIIRRIMNITPSPILYCKLRDMAEDGQLAAIRGISRFQNEEDIQLIKPLLNPEYHNFYFGLQCFNNFPSPKFEPDLLNLFYGILDNKKYHGHFYLICEAMRKINSENIHNAFAELISNSNKHNELFLQLWMSLEREKDYDNYVWEMIISKVGIAKINELRNKYLNKEN